MFQGELRVGSESAAGLHQTGGYRQQLRSFGRKNPMGAHSFSVFFLSVFSFVRFEFNHHLICLFFPEASGGICGGLG